MTRIKTDLTVEDLQHISVELRLAGFKERRDLGRYRWSLMSDEFQQMGVILKRIRKTVEKCQREL